MVLSAKIMWYQIEATVCTTVFVVAINGRKGGSGKIVVGMKSLCGELVTMHRAYRRAPVRDLPSV